ncbi:FAD dependent oxidoreductase [Leptolyngbya boryana NIES-2135]|jgi:beta-carotene ketolase (CrtO type)|uniref:Pyridine nucleotide-disulfide oxidoreductase domain-containing protein 2 n=1 Tax=Leptolyngbya boryana NIES-2135 TaxID=1973484 RepID=A0A1Z4JJJ3_LEPBY|nr:MULTISPECIES: NAD(P)/FAD-dependent oxidoreductase [Leptolyngbya]BAY56858.1 FAD dependent oxidoreductase [Leptolyngbya boryana NIES-2135]MBD2368935.1 NAD(P)/FAD-dependent oxidoreductase [Leptolyngbya sp. FACHB-161]MBD2375858.1 NAD(P)/FAD-dependent oxidoreductase [Leptolyngbya sp. FACHB-238]MBD2399972.1 NAD(P)/FAD-dependent oxidoreductase [Leptolyngbya sp. FACHB-239]MBD2406178.1 NAD(P)/FAD-dependent oxidoreductase [Leptolyngbya sp. FACHB-402]
MQSYDAIIIGAGHNGLVCAAYLLKAGYSVLLLEKNSIPGGAATTEELMPEDAPGFLFSPCAINHIFIHLGPVVEELELEKYGLEYLFCDPVVFCPHPDGKYFLARRSVEQTCAEIARYSPRDAAKYAEFTDFWQRVIGMLTPLFNAPPKSIVDMAGNYDISKIKDMMSLMGSGDKTLDLIRTMLSSPLDVINEYFDSEFLKAPLARLSAELSTPPSQKNMAVGSIMMSLRHNPGMARPKGGTGALTQALVRCVQDLGGEIRTDQQVQRVLIDDGKAVGVRLTNGQEYRSTMGVISSLDAQRLFLQLIDERDVDAADAELRERVSRRIANHNEAILKIDCALSELPRFENHNHQDEYWMGSALIADSVAQVEIAHTDPTIGRIPIDDPSMYMVVPSLLDSSLAPEGQHTLWIEFFVPYQIAGAEGTGLKGTGWTEDLKNQVADRVLDKLAEYTPNLKSSIIARHIESPPELERRIGVSKGNYYHLDMSFDQMMFFRPLPELANYKTPIEGLFLTGAGTHPGGSISGLPGRNCARVILQTEHPVSQTLSDTGNVIKSAAKSLFSRS